MNVIKEYNTAKKKKGNVCYGALGGGRWVFRISDKESGAIEKIIRFSGGAEVAEKIAESISKSWLRTAGKKHEASARIDGRCRRQIDHLRALRTISDWTDEPEWWHNDSNDEPAVKMVYVNQQPVAGISAEDIAVEPSVSVVTEIQQVIAERS